MAMMLARGRCRLLVVVTIDVSDGCNDCSAAAADVGEGELTLLLDVSSPPSPSSPPRCADDDLCCSCCRCCFLIRMSAMMSAVVRPFSRGSVVCC